jgi:RimJ/RimL family protein N-acetyltransferase
LQAELTSVAELGRLLQAEVPPDWPPGEYDRPAQEFFFKRLESGGPEATGWYVWYAVLRSTSGGPGTLIGSGGFFGPPNPAGIVEIGFSILPAWRARGFARELAAGLIDFASNDPRTRIIIAHTTTMNIASCTVLERSGFRPVGPGLEPDQVRYERTVSG